VFSQSAQGLCYVVFLGEGPVVVLNIVHDAYLFLLQFHIGSFGASLQGEIAPLFSVWLHVWRLSTGCGSRMFQSLILIYALSPPCREKKEREREKQLGAFFLGLEARHALLAARQDLCGCLVKLKANLRVSL
jgi:hypothetical protein